ncbi:hypothetical protein [Rhizorhabdus histidinilytica]|uniref:hypothetical protein n=1 Tax=Rhizorhabdus histidinilytica TaxID=439228 RepID=UPI00159191A1|nr:hypothetical protein [Rhizorhabdus histidinilytica]
MSEANERLIATFFHASRAASKRKDSPAVEKIFEALKARAQLVNVSDGLSPEHSPCREK